MNGYLCLTKKCPCRCINCPLTEKDAVSQPDLTLEEVERTVLAGVKKGMQSVILSGGEPTAHPQILDIVRILAKYPIKVSFLTTCVAFANEHFMLQLLEAIPGDRLRLATAIHSFDEEKNDFMTSSKGSLRRTLKGMDNAISAGISTTLKHLITGCTYRDMPSFICKVYERFPSSVPLLFCNIDYCGTAYRQQQILRVSFRESEPYLSAALDYALEHIDNCRQVNVLDTPRCALAPRYWSFLYSQAKMRIPVYNDPGNKGRQHQEDLTNVSGPYFPPCEACTQQEFCSGTWPSVWNIFGESNFRPL